MAGDQGFVQKLPKALPGLALIVITMVVIRLWIEPWMSETVVLGQKGWLVKVTHLNYILLGIIVGALYRNVIFGGRLPEVLVDGFRLSRLMIKTGIILLGSLYTVQAIVKLGAMAIFLIGGFVALSIVMVMWIGRLFSMDRSMTGVLANACGICGVSAAVATAPAVEAKAAQVAMPSPRCRLRHPDHVHQPFIGHALQMTDLQYGAWIGNILNSARCCRGARFQSQRGPRLGGVSGGDLEHHARDLDSVRRVRRHRVVLGGPGGAYAGRAAEDPGHAAGGEVSRVRHRLHDHGLLTSVGAFGTWNQDGPPASETIKMLRVWMTWIFGFGLVGLGGYIDVRELSQAGGSPLKVGLIVGVTKYVLALVVVLLLRDYLVEI
jgi:uncharacterized membrane protein YadS